MSRICNQAILKSPFVQRITCFKSISASMSARPSITCARHACNKGVTSRKTNKVGSRVINLKTPKYILRVHLSTSNSDTGQENTTTNTPDKNKTLHRSTVKVVPKKAADTREKYMSNVFITPVRAFREYLLSPQELSTVWSTKRRSPYEHSPPITVYLRHDVEQKSIEKFGSLQNLETERRKLARQELMYLKGLTLDKPPFLLFNETLKDTPVTDQRLEKERKTIFKSGSGKVVLTAIAINGLNAIAKGIAWVYTGSHAMFSEMIHSLADTINQCILAYGIHHSLKNPSPDHPYGYSNFRYVSSLISGVGIFCVGAGFSWYHGVAGLLHPSDFQNLSSAIALMAGSFLSESITLYMAVKNIIRKSKQYHVSPFTFVQRGQDPSVNVVLMEDLAAVVGVAVAAGCMSLTHLTGSHTYDAIGSLFVGSLLAGVSAFIIQTNSNALLGRSIPEADQKEIAQILESDIMIRSVHDIKATDMGANLIRFKAEVDFDGKLLTKKYLSDKNLDSILQEMKSCETEEDVKKFMLNHGEKIVEMIGGEIDRIEGILKTINPQIRHVDLEML